MSSKNIIDFNDFSYDRLNPRTKNDAIIQWLNDREQVILGASEEGSISSDGDISGSGGELFLEKNMSNYLGKSIFKSRISNMNTFADLDAIEKERLLVVRSRSIRISSYATRQ